MAVFHDGKPKNHRFDAKPSIITRIRDAVTGRFVDKEEARRRPKETVKETTVERSGLEAVLHFPTGDEEITLRLDNLDLHHLSRTIVHGNDITIAGARYTRKKG